MESKKINQLATELAPELSDLTIIGDPTTGISKKITLSQMANLFTGTVEEYPNLASFPLVGTGDTIYIALDTNILYRWDTTLTSYVELSPNIVTSLVFNDANGFDGTISLVGSTATLTITTALTQGSIGFIGASGALTQDNSNFFWDNTNKRLGINTNAPTTAIDAFGSGIIGRLNGTSTNNAFLGFASAGSNKWSIGNVQSDHRFRIYNEATTSELVSVLQTGEVGIGIANPLTKLHIFGGASALIANLDANTSVAKSISFRSGNSSRINLEVSGTESGSNAGANFFLRAYSDAGSLLNTPLTITRSTGAASFISSITAKGGLIFDTTQTVSTSGTIGFNSSVGIFIYGRTGTEADFRLYNSSGLTVMSNPTGTQNTTFNGFVGIGTQTPSYKLNIVGGAEVGSRIIVTGTYAPLQFSGDNSTTLGAINAYSGIIAIGRGTPTGIEPDIAINSSGYIGVGTQSPQDRFHVAGAIFTTSNTILSTTKGAIFDFNDGQDSGRILAYKSTGSNLLFYTNSNGGGLSERMRISNTGNIGIGTSSPNYKLQIDGELYMGNNKSIYLANTGVAAGVIRFFNATSGTTKSAIGSYYNIANEGNLEFMTGGENLRMLITSGGTVLVNATSVLDASAKFQTNGNVYLGNQPTGAGTGTLKYNASTGLVSYDASSRIYKKDIVELEYGLDSILKMQPKKYKWKSNDAEDLGFIADEMYNIIPEIVFLANNKINQTELKDGEPLGINYDRLGAILVKGIQELKAELDEIKTKLA